MNIILLNFLNVLRSCAMNIKSLWKNDELNFFDIASDR